MAGHTLSEVRAILAATGLAPRRRYGQNFLIDLNLMRKLVAAAELSPADVVLEVGPGTGSLTEMLLDRGVRVIAVEIDRGLQGVLRERLGEHPRFTLVHADVLAGKHEINPLVLQLLREQEPAAGGARKLVANLPYQIATPLIMELLLATPRLERLTCTLQKEVGERLRAAADTAAYGPLAVTVQTLAEVGWVTTVPPSAFWPQPDVESVMVTIRPRPAEQTAVENPTDFVAFVRTAFLHRRKMLRTATRYWDTPGVMAALAGLGIDPKTRAEDLSAEQWRALFRAVRTRATA